MNFLVQLFGVEALIFFAILTIVLVVLATLIGDATHGFLAVISSLVSFIAIGFTLFVFDMLPHQYAQMISPLAEFIICGLLWLAITWIAQKL